MRSKWWGDSRPCQRRRKCKKIDFCQKLAEQLQLWTRWHHYRLLGLVSGFDKCDLAGHGWIRNKASGSTIRFDEVKLQDNAYGIWHHAWKDCGTWQNDWLTSLTNPNQTSQILNKDDMKTRLFILREYLSLSNHITKFHFLVCGAHEMMYGDRKSACGSEGSLQN